MQYIPIALPLALDVLLSGKMASYKKSSCLT